MYQNVHWQNWGRIYVFWHETFKVIRFLLSGTWSFPFCYGYCWSYENSHSRRTNSQRKLTHSWSVSKNAKSWNLPCKRRIWSCILFLDLGHKFGSNVVTEFGVMLRARGPRKAEFAYDIVRIYSLMIYTELIEHNFVGDTQALWLHCFFLFSKLTAGDIITTGQYMNYETFSNLQFGPLLKKSFLSFHLDLRDTRGEKIPFVFVGITRFVLTFRKASNIHFQPKRRFRMVVSRQVETPFYIGYGQQRGRDWVHLHKLLGELEIDFCVNKSSQLQIA